MAEISTTFRLPRAFRPSTAIKRKPAANFWHAFNFAKDLGKPLNTFVTLNFAHTDCHQGDVSPTFQLLLARYFGPWWRRPSRLLRLGQQGSPSYVWVAENGSDHPCIHWVLYVPDNRRDEFSRRLPQWLRKVVTTVHCEDNAIDITPVHNAPGLRKYLLKGCEPMYAAFCKIEHKPQGVVFGKRSGVSRGLQRTARGRSRYRPLNRRGSSSRFDARTDDVSVNPESSQ